jgi:hypothetical protein
MHDTDRVVRQPVLSSVSDTGKRARKTSLPDWLDRTPTTAPSWAPPPTTRLARGTSLPPIARPGLEPADSILLTERVERVDFSDLDLVPTLPPLSAAVPPPPLTKAGRTRRAVPTVELAAIGLPIRVVHPPRRWGSVVMCDLDGVPFARSMRPRPAPAPALAEGTGQLRIDLDPSARAPSLIPVIAIVSALALAAAVLLGLLLRPSHAPAAPAPTPSVAPAPAVIQPSVMPLREATPTPDAPVVVPLGFTR